MFARIKKWVNDRWPLSAASRLLLEEDIPGGSSFAYTLGSATLILFLIQAITGVWQMFYYVPTTDHAYNSVNYLRLYVPFGWLIHGIHYWGAQAMVVLVVLHLVRVFTWGAYKRPREMTWLLGVVLLFLVMGMIFTGALLPWDELGYFAAEVGTSIVSTVPVVGGWLIRIVRGGEAMGQLTLSRFFIMHIAIIPGLLMLIVLFHLVAFRKFGSVGPWKEEKRQRTGPFWPNQVLKDTLVGVSLVLVLIALTVYIRAPLTGPADPTDTTFQPKPEWNFLFLYQALKAFKGPWEPVGTVGLPLVGVLILILIPFVDRRAERNPFRRPVAMTFLFLSAVSVITLTITGYFSHPGLEKAAAAPTAAQAAKLSPSAQLGAKLFASLPCLSCHSVNGHGGTTAPDLSMEASRGRSKSWIMQQIQDPKSHFPHTIMPPFSNLSQEQRAELADYLLSLGRGGTAAAAASASPESTKVAPDPPGPTSTEPGPAATMIGNPKHGAIIFSQKCQSCHGFKGTDKVPNPGSDDGTVPPLNPIDRALYNPNAQTFVDQIDPIIQHGSTPSGPHPELKMPDWGDSHTLTQEEIAEVEAYILSLNGVDRAQIVHAGMEPRHFFLLVVIVFGVVAVVLGAIALRLRHNSTGPDQADLI